MTTRQPQEDHEYMTTTRDQDDEMDYSTDPPREDCASGAPQRVLQRKRSAVTSASDDQHTSGTSDAGFKKPPPKKRAAPRQRTPVVPVPTANQYDALQDGADSEDPDEPPPATADDATHRSGPKLPRRQRGLPPLRPTSRSDGQQQRRRAAPPPAPPATPPRQPAQRRLLAARADLGYADVLQGRTTPPPAPAVQPLRRSEDGPAPPAAAADFIAVLQEVQATLVAVSAALAQLPTAITAAVHAALRSFPTATAIASAGHGSQP
ncbi:actin cytoskeleton-regulatory complex protein pan1-like [Schistocerca piceifrons]|uniref:actin cytoskeleton-regulatory complex protein pan1-like n=1 Tax=Schistocerca piceifrons TaxID=274613 RepID=UPI001F5F706D|nr:actin cytoskeleton-regulatory complex protein pan1-like [Schistocerca piceifrons]